MDLGALDRWASHRYSNIIDPVVRKADQVAAQLADNSTANERDPKEVCGRSRKAITRDDETL